MENGDASPHDEDVVGDGAKLVGDPVADVIAHAGPAVSSNHHPAFKLQGAQGGPGGHLHKHSDVIP